MALKDQIPVDLFSQIEQHLNNVCNTNAKSSWRRNKAKEDSISGAFFQGIAVAERMWGDWSWNLEYSNLSNHKIEPHLGADGIFQVEVRDECGRVIFRKGFLYQSKKNSNSDKGKLEEQLENIERHVPNGGLLLTYNEGRFMAVPGKTYLNDRKWENQERNICAFLVQRFLECLFGIRDLYYNFDRDEIMLKNAPLPIVPKAVASINIKKNN